MDMSLSSDDFVGSAGSAASFAVCSAAGGVCCAGLLVSRIERPGLRPGRSIRLREGGKMGLCLGLRTVWRLSILL